MGFHSSPGKFAACLPSKRISYLFTEDIFWQHTDTAEALMPSSSAAAVTDADTVHLPEDPAGLHITGLHIANAQLVLPKVARWYKRFWLDVTYSKLSKWLFDLSPSLWCTSHVSWLGGSPLKVIRTTRWTYHLYPAIPTILYPEGWRYPHEMTPFLRFWYRPKELTCHPEFELSSVWLDSQRNAMGMSGRRPKQVRNARGTELIWMWLNISTSIQSLKWKLWRYMYSKLADVLSDDLPSHSNRTFSCWTWLYLHKAKRYILRASWVTCSLTWLYIEERTSKHHVPKVSLLACSVYHPKRRVSVSNTKG